MDLLSSVSNCNSTNSNCFLVFQSNMVSSQIQFIIWVVTNVFQEIWVVRFYGLCLMLFVNRPTVTLSSNMSEVPSYSTL